METSNTEKYFLFGLLAIVLVLTLAILYPFLSVFILAAAFTVVINPVYVWIKKHITKKNSGLASLITIVLFLITLCIPLFFMGVTIFNQAQNAYYSVVTNGDTSLFIQKIDTAINDFLPSGFVFDTHAKVMTFSSFLSNNIGNFFASTFNTLLMIIITIFTMFYLLKDGDDWRDALIKILPLSEKNIKEILSDLKNSINRILKGSFLIAIVQGTLSWLGLWFFGVPNPALWGVVAGLASFIPNLGTSVVSVPAIIYLYINGMQIEALGLLLWSAAIVGTIDNILSPYVISKGTEIPPLFVLFSILGGITLLGPLGILLGPLILSLLYSLVSIYRKEMI
jgi:predicted PurR-regulated permease PerM